MLRKCRDVEVGAGVLGHRARGRFSPTACSQWHLSPARPKASLFSTVSI